MRNTLLLLLALISIPVAAAARDQIEIKKDAKYNCTEGHGDDIRFLIEKQSSREDDSKNEWTRYCSANHSGTIPPGWYTLDCVECEQTHGGGLTETQKAQIECKGGNKNHLKARISGLNWGYHDNSHEFKCDGEGWDLILHISPK